mmetsp:Transcript_10368/g.23870  ORF Transcript_10368/g.23870 Transcript_10368/m.23870 type:complete len:128 (-) Transcript_10368:168-551(-)
MATPEGQTEPTAATPVEDAEMSGGAAPEAPTNEAAPATPAAETKPKEYDNAEVGQTAEAAALNVSQQLNLQSLPIRQYLETTVVSLLVNGLTQLVKARPEDPVEYLAAYLLKNNPKKKGGAPNAPNP